MLVELGVVEQRHKAVLEVLDGAKVIDMASDCAKNGSLARDPAQGNGGRAAAGYARPRAVSGV